MDEKLIEFLAEKCNLLISDLKQSENYIRILPVIMETGPSCFPVEDWSKSISYIFGEDVTFKEAPEAKVYFMKKLLRNI